MYKFNPGAIEVLAADRGWIHASGRLAGTLNASKMATHLGVAKTTVTRAYDGGAAGLTLLEKLSDESGKPLEFFLVKAA